MAEITFYTNPMSRGQIARWALHEAGADYETVLVDWMNKPRALLDANPMGKVPMIVHHAAFGDQVVTETAAICAYLAEIHSEAGLRPDATEQADYLRWLFFAAGPLEQALSFKALDIAIPDDPMKQGMLGCGTIERTVKTLEGHLAANAYICGDRFTMADVYVGSHVDWGMGFGTIPKTEAFEAYAERCRAREAYQVAKAIDNGLIEKARADA